ncbi:hypothetical protein ACFXGA_12325 [Actinosynnema sp. NPDC059335]|uniref:hypothetical protein n=1 Tax=Actinosynnema sp. NPDC059335 TaxID=3346804 RepID=UPI003670BC65
MPDRILRLRHRDILRALDGFDLLDVVAQELIRRAGGGERSRAGADAGVAVSTAMTSVGEAGTGPVCLLPTPSLRMVGLAALATLAIRELCPAAAVTAAVFGAGPAARLHLSLIARYLPHVAHASVHPSGVELDRSVERRMRGELARAGTTLSVHAGPPPAALGANLLVVTEPGWGRLDLGRLRPGTVIVNATRRDLPDEVLIEVHRLYVDDLGLLEHNQHRAFVRLHQEVPDGGPGPDGRRAASWRHERRIDTDLGQVLIGAHGGTDADEVVLVELLEGGSLDVRLAGRVHRAVLALGLDAVARGPGAEG